MSTQAHPELIWKAQTAGKSWKRYALAHASGLELEDGMPLACIGQCQDGTWNYTIFASDDDDDTPTRGIGLPSVESAVDGVEKWWRGVSLVVPPRASAEERADAYRELLLGIVGTGDPGGYQDIEILTKMRALGDLPDRRDVLHADLHHLPTLASLQLEAAFKAIDEAKSPEQRAAEAEKDARLMRAHIYQSLTDLGREVLLRLRADPTKSRSDFGGHTLTHLERYGLIEPDQPLAFTDLGKQIADGIFKRLRKDLKPFYS